MTTKIPVELSSTPGIVDNSNATAITIDSSERVGIGTTSPSQTLHVDGIVASQNSSQGSGLLQLQGYGNIAYINHSGSGNLHFRMGSGFDTRMSLTTAGNLGIGTSSPSAPLHVVGHSFVQNGTLFTDAITSYSGSSLHLNAGSSNFRVTVDGSERVRIDTSGNLGIGDTNPSAIRLSVVTPTANHVGLQVENSNTADSFGMIVKGGNDANDYTADFRKRDNTGIMRIRGDGNIGIGTTSPNVDLHIVHAGSAGLKLETDGDNDANFIQFITSSSSSQGYIGNESSSAGTNFTGTLARAFVLGSTASGTATQLISAGTVKTTIDSSGNVGIGTTPASASSTTRMHIHNGTSTAILQLTGAGVGTTASDGTELAADDNGDFRIRNFESGSMQFYNNGSERMRLQSDGRLLYNTTSVFSGGSDAGDASLQINGAINRVGSGFTDFNEAYVSNNRGIFEGTSGFQASNAPSGSNWWHLVSRTVATGGSANYITQVATSITGAMKTRYSANTGSTWSSWVDV